MKKLFIGCYNKSVILTYIGVLFAILGMFHIENITFSIICLIVSGLCDMFDGKIARMCKRTEQEKEFGIQIDSLCDVISFLILPIIIFSQICKAYDCPITPIENYEQQILSVISVLYVLAGITRLAWFNINVDGTIKDYQGLPVTSISIILPIIYLIFQNKPELQLCSMITMLLVAILFVYNFKVKKLKGIWYPILLILGIIGCFLFFPHLK